MVDIGKATDILESIREHLPEELQIAREVAAAREQKLEEAAADAQHLIEEARMRAEELVRDEGIYKTAERQARALLDQAEARAQDVRERADDYALESLRSLEVRLDQTLATVQNGIATLQAQTTDAEPVPLT